MIEQFNAIVRVVVLCYVVYLVYFGMKNLLQTSAISKEEQRQFTIISGIIVAIIMLAEVFEKIWGE